MNERVMEWIEITVVAVGVGAVVMAENNESLYFVVVDGAPPVSMMEIAGKLAAAVVATGDVADVDVDAVELE